MMILGKNAAKVEHEKEDCTGAGKRNDGKTKKRKESRIIEMQRIQVAGLLTDASCW